MGVFRSCLRVSREWREVKEGLNGSSRPFGLRGKKPSQNLELRAMRVSRLFMTFLRAMTLSEFESCSSQTVQDGFN